MSVYNGSIVTSEMPSLFLFSLRNTFILDKRMTFDYTQSCTETAYVARIRFLSGLGVAILPSQSFAKEEEG